MSKLKKFFREIIKGNKLASRIVAVQFIWIPILVPSYFISKDTHFWMNFFIFIVIFIIGAVLLYFLFKKLVINRQFRSNNGAFLFFVILFLQNIIMNFLYGYKILTSKKSLFITILASIIIAILCLFTMMRVSDNKKRIHN